MFSLVVLLVVYGALSLLTVLTATMIVIRTGRLKGLDPQSRLVRWLSARRREPGVVALPLRYVDDNEAYRLMIESLIFSCGSSRQQVKYSVFVNLPSLHSEQAFEQLLMTETKNYYGALPRSSGERAVPCAA